MGYGKWAAKAAANINPLVADLFGVNPLGFNITVARPGAMATPGSVGQDANGNIMLNRQWLKSVGRDPGLIAHELAHIYGADEIQADAARVALGGKFSAGWTPSAEAVAAVTALPGGSVTQPNGPRPGRTHGRNRSTLGNQASKAPGGVGLPVVSPQSAVGYGAQTANTTAQYLAQLALLRGQKALVKGQFQQDRASAQQQAVADMATAVNSSLERGMVGSSTDLGGRAGVLAGKATAVSQALIARVQGMLGIRQSQLQAQNDYYTQLFQIQAAKRAEQMAMATAALANDQVLRPGDEQVKSAAPAPAAPTLGASLGVGPGPNAFGVYGVTVPAMNPQIAGLVSLFRKQLGA